MTMALVLILAGLIVAALYLVPLYARHLIEQDERKRQELRERRGHGPS